MYISHNNAIPNLRDMDGNYINIVFENQIMNTKL